MPRPPRPDDLYALRLPTDVRLSPDGSRIVYSLQESAPDLDAYRFSLWIVPADGSAPARRLTLGARRDTCPRWSPDGRTLAFLSDRGAVLAAGGGSDRPTDPATPKDGRGDVQVWLLPMDGGEASQLTRLPEDVTDLAWSPDGTRLCLVSAAVRPDRIVPRREPGEPPVRDVRLIDRLQYQLNGAGFTYDREPNLWVVDVRTGEPRRLTSGASHDTSPAWSPDGSRIAFVSNRHADADLTWRTDLYLVDAAGGTPVRITGGRGDRAFGHPAWSPDGSVIAAYGHRMPIGAASRADLWLFRPVKDDLGENLTAASDRELTAVVNSDLLGFSVSNPIWSADGAWLVVAAPIEGSYELWRVRRADGSVERLTQGRHVLSRQDAVARKGGGLLLAAVLQTATASAEVVTLEIASPPKRGAAAQAPLEPRPVTRLTAEMWGDLALVEPQERWHEVDGRRIQGWFLEAPARDGRPAPLVVEIHGGPATLYGWSLFWEWQCLVASGVSVYACNPRGSEGYGQDFVYANFRDWGHGPMADVMAGVDGLIADGKADPDRLGVTGGSYGGYLTAWIIGHSDRFRAAVACRGVYDMTAEMLSGDIGGPLFGKYEYGANPWEDPELYRAHSPITYADAIHTPLLIQHAEKDLRCPITQAEELFTVLRSMRRPVRLMRTPDETHELTRSGKPFRRVENLERIRDWFSHFLVDGKRGLPPA
jgi:dipeptidyl aminopeptidase/acylaminoacyl peptidase